MELLRPFDSLPLELICRILCFLGPRDVGQLRSVSKLFHGITYDPVIWKVIYANAPLPRPPGPFPYQSTRFFEQTLRRSEQLAERWTTQPIRAVSSTQISLEGSSLGSPRIIGGKWLVICEPYRRIVFHDIETHSRQVLWEDTGITSWHACSVMSASGHLVYVVFCKGTHQEHCKLLEFRVHGDSGHLSHSVSIDVPVRNFGRLVRLVGNKGPFLYISRQDLVFDTRCRAFYEFPAFGSEFHEIHASLFMTSDVLLTNTHIIVASNCLHKPVISSAIESTLIQVFTLPAAAHPASNETGVLRLSHEGIIPVRLSSILLVRNSIINSATESTSLRYLLLLLPAGERDRLHYFSVDLMLPRSLSDVILPVFIEVNDVFTVEGGHFDLRSPHGYYLEASDDGHARGFCRNPVENDRLTPPYITKFTVDATGDKCVAAVGSASPPQWNDTDDDVPSLLSTLSFDGVIGRFCYIKRGHNGRHAVIVDIE